MDRSGSPLSSLSSRSVSAYSDTFGLLGEKAVTWRMPRVRHLGFIFALIGLGIISAEIVWRLPGFARYSSTIVLNGDVAAWLDEPRRFNKLDKSAYTWVIAIVMYSSRAKLSILDCYLQQNLVSNGGVIDSVVLVPETGDEEDLDWLHLLADSYNAYTVASYIGREGDDHYAGINLAWRHVQPGTLYIHICSEIVFLEPTTIPSLVETKLNRPEYAIVSANLVNQPTLSWVHHHLGVVRPYRPEMKSLLRPLNTSNLPRYDWRATDLPTWNGPRDFDVPADFGIPTDFQPPFNGHRWLPLRTNETSFNPLTHEGLDMNGPGQWSWTTGALHHYSFLEHLEQNELHMYKFPMWDFQAELLSPSMIAMWGKDIIEVRPMPVQNADKWLSREVPKQMGGRCKS